MSVIRTKTNMVCAYDPEADDLFVQVVWHGPDDDGRHLRAFEGPPWPIENYQAAIDWAVSMADQMRFPLYVVPLRFTDTVVIDSLRQSMAKLTDRQRGELRGMVVNKMAEVMRNSAEPVIRANAFEVLVDMGVVKYERPIAP